ncbi:PREDICTED: protein FAR1-RELATED SEQUENCE 5-like [Camelina sativa]|uniref:Protein FAR1-RELATED SEQUENCE 5-like n=1 Tax=Camelina sativa TaxID=90675 RepID=A0ABM0Y4B0_CAMSA|nr:PREDICTED: protein FAR1-RELATED SEQUENCE 5-like [Camelina sativa]
MVNPGTITSVELDEEKRFKFLFIALGACIEGFRAMRKVIVVDATHLKTMYGGMLVFATAQDPNHHHYPIAFGVIDTENHVSWPWFFNKLKTVVPDDPELVFISDRHKSIIYAVSEVYPSARHAHCIYHLSKNLREYVKTDKDIASDKFKECAHIYTKNDFDREFMDFRRRFPNAAKYLDEKIGLDKWARCHFEGDKYNIDTSNAAESMNSVFVEARKTHLLPMIDTIIEKFSEWFNKHRKDSAGASNTRKLVPVVENELHDRCEIAVRLTVIELNIYHLEYNVIGLDGKTYLVDLKMKSCSCRCFDIDKYPCVHAMAALRNLMRREVRRVHIEMHDLCSIYYLIETWALAYYRTIYVVPHESDWNVPAAIRQLMAKPPEYTKTGGGRTQEKKFRSIAERRRKRRRQMKFKPGINLEKFLQPPNLA